MNFQPYTDPEADLCQWMYLTSKLGWWQCSEKPLEDEEFCAEHLGPALKSNDDHDAYEMERDMAAFDD